MKAFVCPHESAVWRAARAARWDESLTAHLRECSVCREIVQATGWMQTLAQPDGNTLALPDASLLWRQGRLSQKQAEMERALRPLDAIEILPAATAALVFVSWFLWNLYSTGGLFAWIQTQMLPQIWRITWTAATTAPEVFSSEIFLIAAAALSLGALLATSPLLAKR